MPEATTTPPAAEATAAAADPAVVPPVESKEAADPKKPPLENASAAAGKKKKAPSKKPASSSSKKSVASRGPMLKRTTSAPPAVLQRKRSRSGPKSKSSSFIGVSQYRRTGRWEAHIWDCAKSRKTPGAKGRQLHLGSFDCAEDAARAYDRAAIHFRGDGADTNYPREQYTHDPVLSALKDLSKEQFVVRLRGVAQHHKIQTQKKKDKKAPAPIAASDHVLSTVRMDHAVSLKRTTSFPLRSPQSVLPAQNIFAPEDCHAPLLLHHPMGAGVNPYQGGGSPGMYPDPLSYQSLSRRRSSGDIFSGTHLVRLPHSASQEGLVYSGRVVSSDYQALAHQQVGMISDPVHASIGQGVQSHHAHAHALFGKHQQHQQQQQGMKDKDPTLLFFEDSLFPEEYSPTETLQGHIKQDRQLANSDYCKYILNPTLEEYHILDEAKKSLFATSSPKQEARAGTSRPMERFMAQFAPREGDQSGYRPPVSADDLAIPPLMEGMGEVDTGAF